MEGKRGLVNGFVAGESAVRPRVAIHNSHCAIDFCFLKVGGSALIGFWSLSGGGRRVRPLLDYSQARHRHNLSRSLFLLWDGVPAS